MRHANRTILLSLFALLFATGAHAASDLKIGVVDFRKLLAEAPQAKAVQQQLQQQFAPRLKEVQGEQQALERELENFRRDSAVMGAGERERRESEIKRRDLDFQRRQRELEEDVNIARNEAVGKLQRELISTVQEYAKSKKYDLLVSEGIIYMSDKADITEDVLKALEKAAR